MSNLRPITDAEAHPWPRTCRVCGEAVGAAAWTTHQVAHVTLLLRDTAASTRGTTHAMLALGDALERHRAPHPPSR